MEISAVRKTFDSRLVRSPSGGRDYPSFLLGLLLGFALIVLLIYLILRWSVKEDARLFSKQRLLDSYLNEDQSLK